VQHPLVAVAMHRRGDGRTHHANIPSPKPQPFVSFVSFYCRRHERRRAETRAAAAPGAQEEEEEEEEEEKSPERFYYDG